MHTSVLMHACKCGACELTCVGGRLTLMRMNVCACKVLGEVRNSTELISNDSIIPARREEVPLSSGDGGSYLPRVAPADPGHVMRA